MGHPLLQQPSVRSFHQLVAALELLIHPARYVAQTFGGHTA
jgi:hypothetical protein